MKYHSQVLVLGAGAAGLMCAIEAGKRGRSVTVLESSPRAGQKILISGGGRCNFTNRDGGAEKFISENPHFAKSALARYTPQHFISLVERHGIGWHVKKLGQLFCDRSAQDILSMLEEECVRAGVRVKLGTVVRELRHAQLAAAATVPHLPKEGRYGAPSSPSGQDLPGEGSDDASAEKWRPTSAWFANHASRCGMHHSSA